MAIPSDLREPSPPPAAPGTLRSSPATTDTNLAEALAAVTTEIGRTDGKASLLLAFNGATLAGLATLAGRRLPTPATVLGILAATALGTATVLLLMVVRPCLSGSDRASFPHWARLTETEIRGPVTPAPHASASCPSSPWASSADCAARSTAPWPPSPSSPWPPSRLCWPHEKRRFDGKHDVLVVRLRAPEVLTNQILRNKELRAADAAWAAARLNEALGDPLPRCRPLACRYVRACHARSYGRPDHPGYRGRSVGRFDGRQCCAYGFWGIHPLSCPCPGGVRPPRRPCGGDGEGERRSVECSGG
ncbi:Pycsar system effector family protein [Streptomyces sp. NPDC001292]|uniref:Pycsar system effector family protein n=1 Tax=Streptomyces sp. NPDC001292 TaxID=3364558 RepID=UPI00369B6148